MKKNTYLTILTIATILCIVGGSVFHVTKLVTHVIIWPFSYLFSLDDSQNKDVDLLEGLPESGSNSDSGASRDTDPEASQNAADSAFAGFENITLNASALEIKIRSGAEYDVTYSGPDKYTPTAEINGSTLTITQSDVSLMGTNECGKLTVTVPADCSLSLVSIDSNVADLELRALNIDTLTLHTNVGDIDVDDCTIRSANISGDLGDIDVKECSLEEAVIECHVGDVQCEKTTYSRMEIQNNLGDIDLEYSKGTSYNIDASCDAGSVKVDGQHHGQSYKEDSSSAEAGTIAIHCNAGEIELESFK